MAEWLPALSTTSLLVVGLWFGRNLITTRLAKSVQHEFDEKLANVRAELEKENELFKAEIRRNEAQINSLQSGALTGLISRQAVTDKRRLEAVDQLWASVISLRIGKGVTALMATIKFDAAVKEAAKNEKFREMFKSLTLDHEKFAGVDDSALKARPYISTLAWAFYAAYQAIIMHSVAKATLLKVGFDEPKVIDFDGVKKILIEALPHQAAYINEYGTSVGHFLLDELEGSILAELRKMLDGQDGDRESVQRAAAIIKVTEQLNKSTEQENPALKE